MRYHFGFYPTAPSGSSLDRHRFRQIAWLVYIGAFYDSYMIGQQLHRHAVDQRGDQRVDLWHGDRCQTIDACGLDAVIVADQHHLAAARLHFLHIADGFFKERTRRRDDDARSDETTSEIKSLIRSSYAVLCLQKKN